ncbi:MAG: hypothetical protein IT365_22645 [Candidatus Hydrogenedentes bacterium]|nr:hypothetical protein [Candidatus Hydrogenedentota bacterium]
MTESESSGTAGLDAVQARPRASRWRKLAPWGLLLVLAAGAYYWATHAGRGAPNPTPSFSGDSRELTRTQIVPTLDTPIEPGKNVVWCATFLAGWKQLQQNVIKGPVQVSGADEVCTRLNAAADPAQYMPPEVYYATAGTEDKGILQTIKKDMAAKFPRHEIPAFEGIAPGSFVLYSYLEARVPFPVPYFDSRSPFTFTGSDGVKTPVRSFGIRKKDGDRYLKLRGQPQLLMAEWPGEQARRSDQPPTAFAVDLCRDSYPCQIVVSCMEREDTLSNTLSVLKAKCDAYSAGPFPGSSSLEGKDILLVPDMFWQLEHHLAELEGHRIESPPIQGQRIDVAFQEIQFRLDRSGAELFSEAYAFVRSAGLGHYICDRPFLVIMKQRGQETPFFVLWVDNADLLQAWD